MVPAWAAVAIAIGASAIGALAGIFGAYISLRIARLNLDHQASEAWRTRQLEAAEQFSESWTGTVNHVGVLRAVVYDAGDPTAALEALRERHADCGAKLMRVGLLFGADSAAREAARKALSASNQASEPLDEVIKNLSDDREAAARRCTDLLSKAQAAHREFVRVAHTQLQSTPADRHRRRRAAAA